MRIAVNELDDPHTYLEIGCGEGELFRRLHGDIKTNFAEILGCDIDNEALTHAKSSVPWANFSLVSIYDVATHFQAVDMLVCCEVLEHLEDPVQALDVLGKLCKGTLIVSVPREPLWRILNMSRGKYIKDFGNTPGHLNHWSSGDFRKLLSTRFDVIKELRPLPWIMFVLKPRHIY